ncbi:lysophospholipid acyltransferase family protein [Mycobacterium sp. URHB0044]|jgi:1-acyl-sn-glycerol-3-phosphate acyltransferase|uniref:lysophospholipid acyltransferase family protein n=1 Tax=Mycobacterium sp. URHB0044 TaxID=1380386 RepID=UPI00048C29D9|nr:lysophospholipid acyltransferase family protein [Mycobacterium sp. URHB0044]
MSDADEERVHLDEISKWDPDFTRRVFGFLRPVMKRYFRAEVRGADRIPPVGGVLLVSNHSGGQFSLDVPILAIEFYEKFGYDRPIRTLAHDFLFTGPAADVLQRLGIIRATRTNADEALRSGDVVMVFPGGDYDACRPTSQQDVVDFNGRTGYVRAAIEAGVPIVPAVSIGGQENQLYLTRGTELVRRLGGIAKAARLTTIPVSLGLPFGLSLGGLLPPNLPLPTKIVTQVLEPIDVTAQFGEHPDIAAVDAYVRRVMQDALTKLSRQRRLPILG